MDWRKLCSSVNTQQYIYPAFDTLFPLTSVHAYDPNVLLKNLCASSTPKKVAAFAGTALASAGPNPGKKALMPPLLYTPLIVPPIVGLPSALCNLDLIVSIGKTGIHMAMPAQPPAAMTAGRDNWPVAFPFASFGVSDLLTYS